MNTTKSKNNMAAAWMNQKKENEKLKSQIVVLEANQNGVRLKTNEAGFYENVTINPDNIFRWPIVSESVITANFIEDDDESLIMMEMEKEWKAMEEKMSVRLKEAKAKKMRKDIIEQLRADVIRKRAEAELLIKEAETAEAKAEAIINKARDETTITKEEPDKNAPNHKPEKNNEQRERQIVKRKDLTEVITRRTQFKTTIKGQVKIATTEDGRKINGDGVEYDTLNKWLDASVRAITGDNKTKKSVFEVILYYNDERKEWRKLGDDYTAETTKLN